MLKRLQETARSQATGRVVTDVRMGLCYTGAQLDDGSTGVALTFRNDLPKGCSCRGAPMAGQPADELLAGLTSDDLIARTVALAVANAVLNRPHAQHVAGDTLEMLQPSADDVVGMVGYFGPLVPKIRKQVRSLSIFEKVTAKSQDLLPEEQAPEILPRCSVAILTSTALLNGSIEKLIDAGAQCREIVLLGASTPLAPDAFVGTPVTCLSGVIVTDAEKILGVVSEAGGMQAFRGAIRKVNVRRLH